MRERRIEGGVSYLLESLSRQCTATRVLSGSSNKVICFSFFRGPSQGQEVCLVSALLAAQHHYLEFKVSQP